MTAFDTALAFTLPAEGGYVNDPNDHGGATNRGITQATYDCWRDAQHLNRRDVAMLTDAETAQLYQEMYWNPGHCADLTLNLAVVHFDWCVNHGVSGALNTLQQILGVEADGAWGPATAAAAAAAPVGAYYEYVNARRAWYTARIQSHPDQAGFGPGWMKRCDRLQQYVEGLK